MADEDRELNKHPAKCPKCGSHDIRRSKGDGFFALIQRTFGRWPYRCRSCRMRFYRSPVTPEDMEHE